MIILTNKQLQQLKDQLKEEIKRDLREEVVQETKNMIVKVFQQMFDKKNVSIIASDEESKKSRRIRYVGSSIRNTIQAAAINLSDILDFKVMTQYGEKVIEMVSSAIADEAFIDDVIDRINRKQLIGGK